MGNVFDQFDPKPAGGNVFDQFDAPSPADPAPAPTLKRSSAARRVLGDSAVDLGKGVMGLGQAAVGAADLVSGGHAGKALQAIGYDPGAATEALDAQYSPERQAANKAVNDAHGFMPTLKRMVQNPSTIAGSLLESAPSMVGAGGIARSLETKLASAVARSGIGEGAVQAGQAAEQSREQSADGLLTGRQSADAVASGIGDALIVAGSGGVAKKLGLPDVETLLAGGAAEQAAARAALEAAGKKVPGPLARLAGGVMTEGVLQELPQSAQEQMWQNDAAGKPLMEGVPEASAQGLITGAMMGGPTAAMPLPKHLTQPVDPSQDPTAPIPGAAPGSMSDVVNTVDATTQPQATLFRQQKLATNESLDLAAKADPNGVAKAIRDQVDAATGKAPAAAPEPVQDTPEQIAAWGDQLAEQLHAGRPLPSASELAQTWGVPHATAAAIIGHAATATTPGTLVDAATTTHARAESPEATAPETSGLQVTPHSTENWTDRAGKQTRANVSTSKVEGTAGALDFEVRSGPDDANPLQLWVTRDGKLTPRLQALSHDSGDHPNLWNDGTHEQQAAVLDLLRQRGEHALGSDERSAIDAKIKGIVTGDKGTLAPKATDAAAEPGAPASPTDARAARPASSEAPPAPGTEQTPAGSESASPATTAPGVPTAAAGATESSSAAPSAEAGKGAVIAAIDHAATNPLNDTPAPTEAQKDAGNYKKGHVKIAGLNIAIENPAGTKRNEAWPALAHHYGYIKGTIGKDKDHVDVFLTEHAEDTSRPVFVVDQKNAKGGFDEHKVVLGAATGAEARAAYNANYEKGWDRAGAVTQMTHAQFEAWARDPAATVLPAERARAGLAAQPPGETSAQPGSAPAVSAGAEAGGTQPGQSESSPSAQDTPHYGAAIEDVRPQGKKAERGFGFERNVLAAIEQRGLNPDDYTITKTPLNGFIGVRKAAVDKPVAKSANPGEFVGYTADGQPVHEDTTPSTVTPATKGEAATARVKELKAKLVVAKRGGDNAKIDALEREIARTRRDVFDDTPIEKPATKAHDKATAPEHVAEHRLQGVSVPELKEMAAAFREHIDTGGDAEVTHVFDAPAKKEIVRLADKVKVYHAEHGWMTPKEARAKIDEWEARALEQGRDGTMRSINGQKIVLSFFDLSGKWSLPWEQAGYQVYRFDIQDDSTFEHEDEDTGEITERKVGDVNNMSVGFFNDMFGSFDGLDVHAILAACPCTDFAVSGARHFATKDADGRTVSSVALVKQTLAAIEYFKPATWAIENPVGRIESLTGLPPWRLSFDPNHVGEDYTKKTLIWGRFNADLPVAPTEPTEGSKMHRLYGGKSMATKNARSETPEGFAYAFFMANNAIDNPLLAVAGKYDRLDRNLIAKALDAGVTPKEIDNLVEDFYYSDLDDDAANEALRTAAAGTNEDLIEDREREAKRQADNAAEAARYKLPGKDAGSAEPKTAPLFKRGAVTVQATEPGNENAGFYAYYEGRMTASFKFNEHNRPVYVKHYAEAGGVRDEVRGAIDAFADSRAEPKPDKALLIPRRAPNGGTSIEVQPIAQDKPAVSAEQIELPSDLKKTKAFPYGRGERINTMYGALTYHAYNGDKRRVRDEGWESDPLLPQMRAETEAGKFGQTQSYSEGVANKFAARYEQLLRERYAAQTNDERAAKPAVSANTIFTEDKANAARELLRKKLSGTLNSGLDPEVMQAGIELAGYHIEKGARTFAAYSKAMLDDLGEMIRPYLKSWYLAVKFDPRSSALDGMDGAAAVEAATNEAPAAKGPITRVLVNQLGRDGLTDAEREAGKKPYTALSEPQMVRLEQVIEQLAPSDGRSHIERALAKAQAGESPQIVASILDRAGGLIDRHYPAHASVLFEVADQVRDADERAAPSQESAQNPATEATNVRPPDNRQDDREGSAAGDQRQQPAQDRNDDAAAHLDAEQPGKTARPGRVRGAAAGAETPVPGGTRASGGGANEQFAPHADGVPANSRGTPDAVIPKSNFTITGELDFTGIGAVGKFKQNLAAIALLKQLEAEDRHASPAEQSILARYVGWGGLPQAFRHPTSGKIAKGWEGRVAELEQAMTPEELAAAGRSTQDAHYTAANVVQSMWSAVKALGFDHGRVLEPSMGTGNFFGLMPHEIRASSHLTGVELDAITGRIAKQLYQQANVQVRGFNDIRLAPGSFDLAIGNPPFGAQSIHDTQYPDLSGFSIHNFFFAKSIASLRPGGVLAMVVSNSFLDANTSTARAWIAERARLLGAIRLPQTAFQANAGTAVTTDIVFLQRLAENEQGNGDDWVRVGSASDKGNAFALNKYFLAHPDMMLGKMTWSTHTTHNAAGAVLEANPGEDLTEALASAIAKLPQNVYKAPGKSFKQATAAAVEAETSGTVPIGARVYGYFKHSDGTLRQRQPDHNGAMQSIPVELPPAQAERVMAMAHIRDLARDLLASERREGVSDAALEAKRKALNVAYDAFVKQHGRLSRDVNKRLYRDDADVALLMSLEKDYDRGVSSTIAKKTGTPSRKESAKKADLFTKRLNYPEKQITAVTDAKSAMMASLNEHGRLDGDYMAGLYAGKSIQEIEDELGDLVFRDPAGELHPADLYLSGNVKAKLAEAKAAMADNPAMARNVQALEDVQPADVDPADIFVQIGTPWIPVSDYADFARETFEGNVKGGYVRALGGWRVDVSSTNKLLAHDRWGHARMGADTILEKLMGNKPIAIYDKGATRDDPDVLNKEDTAAAKGKAEELQQHFLEWLWKDAGRRERLARFYNDTFNTDVRWKPDGSHMTFPGMNRGVLTDGVLRPHQAAFVYRVVQQGVALADHVVGAGKTYAAIASVMEMRRLGLWRKPMLAVPNHLVDQWAADFARLYPGANVLAASRKDFAKGNRKKLFARIATGDWDAVIVAHSSFGFIPLPAEAEARIMSGELDEIAMALDAMRENNGKKDLSFKQLQKREEALRAKLDALNDKPRDDLLDFEEMGVDALTVDEAHEFKNLYYVTTQRGVAGLGSPEGSKKAFDMYVKTQHLAGINGGKNRVFLTGTPVSNSLSEVFHMQRYLQLDELKARGIAMFDTWASTFGQIVADWEMDAAGRFKEKSRFRKFANLPELVTMWRRVADTVTMADLKRDAEAQGKTFPIPKIKGGKRNNITVARSPLQAAYIGVPTPQMDEHGQPRLDKETGLPIEDYPEGSIIYRMDHMPKDPAEDNHLKATGDARKASLDYRLVDPDAPDFAGSKINRAVADVAQIHHDNTARRGTQLIFCDLSVPASARGKATASAQARVPTWFTTDSGELEHVAGVKLTLSAMPNRPFFSVKGKYDYTVYEAGSGARVASGRSKQEAIDHANSELAKSPKQHLADFEANVIPGDVIDAYVQRWQDAKAAAEEALAASGKDVPEDEAGPEETISMDDLLADSSKHSVYDDVKAKLIAAGVPANEIAFIHDYNTDLQKADLFAKVNRGDIRVLMGSTAKMGAGMNVQKKLVALHHLDAPWRPSDMTQREGRAIRQGNEFYEADPDGFEMVLNAYGTQETYDSRQYEIIETKAKGIESFQAGDSSVREIDDIASESASSADMKAAASGNPLVLESIKLRTEVRNLEAQAQGHKRAQHAMESLIRSVENKTAWQYDNLAKTQARQAKYGANPFALTLGKTTFTDPKEVKAAPILALLKSAIESPRDTVRGGSFRGLEVLASMTFGGTAIKVSLFDGKDQVGVTEFGKDETVSPSGFVTRLENIFKRLPVSVSEAEAGVAKLEREAGQGREELKRGFPKADELATKRARQAAVVNALRSGKREVEGDKPAVAPHVAKPRPVAIGQDGRMVEEGRAAPVLFSRPDPVGSAPFKAFFRQSKVVARDGTPMPVFHGTADEFWTFDQRKLASATGHMSAPLGHFFAEDRAKAERYAAKAAQGVPADETVMAVYLSIQKPKAMTTAQLLEIDSKDEAMALRTQLQAQGFDGIHLTDIGQWIAFDSRQIKSAEYNNGNFDQSDPDIRFSRPDGAAMGMPPAELATAIRAVTDGWKGDTPAVHTVATAAELPAAAKTADGWRWAEGYYDDATQAVYLVAENMASSARALEVLAHEVVGHYGMEAITGPALWAEITDTVRHMRTNPKHAAFFAELGRRYVGANEAIGVREAVAVMAEKGVKNSVMDRVIGALRKFLREKLGLNLKLGEAELRQMIVAAARYVRQGTRPRVNPQVNSSFSNRPAPFFSGLLETVERGKGAPKKADAKTWAGYLDGAARRGEIRQSERDWMGVDAWLNGRGTTTREQLADFIRTNQVKVSEVTLGGPATSDRPAGETARETLRNAVADLYQHHGGDNLDDAMFTIDEWLAGDASDADAARELGLRPDELTGLARAHASSAPQFAAYQTPGGQNYRELLLTLDRPSRTYSGHIQFRANEAESADEQMDNLLTDMGGAGLENLDYGRIDGEDRIEFNGFTDDQMTQLEEFADRHGIPSRDVFANADTDSATEAYSSSHFQEVNNILAHVRYNERTDVDGARTLFLEEIQSDWHQAGRRRGYQSSSVFFQVEHKTSGYVVGQFPTQAAADARLKEFPPSERMALHVQPKTEGADGVPDAPFKGSDEWAMLAFKRMVREAADRGFDRIAWTTGDMQAARYDLSKQVDHVTYDKTIKGFFVNVISLDGPNVLSKDMTPDEVASTLGKDVLEKMQRSEGEHEGDRDPDLKGTYTLRGAGLKVGGEGMRGFYDKLLPATVNKWAKKFGAKVGTTTITTPGEPAVKSFLASQNRPGLPAGALTVHSLELTGDMKEAALAGLPLFSRPDPTTTVNAIDAAAKGLPAKLVEQARERFAGLNLANLRENTRPTWLGALALRHLAELGNDIKLRQVGSFAKRVQQMATDRNIMQNEMGEVAKPWVEFQRKDRAGADATANLMHDSTIAGVDPSVDYAPLTTGTTARGPDEAVTADSIRDRLQQVARDRASTTSETAWERLDEEAAQLKGLLAREKARVASFPAMVQRFLALPKAGQEVYVAARAAYGKQSARLEKAIIDRIESTQASGKVRQEFIATLRHQFETARLEGPYFPLQRFGEFWIDATKNGKPFFSLYESVQEWRKAQRELAANGYVVKAAGRQIKEARQVASVNTGFMAELQQQLEAAGVDDSTRDDVWQLFLRTLPELSMRKHAIHRKKTAGYSKDALRAFASNMFHGSFQIARVMHTHELEADLLALKQATAAIAQDDPERAAKAAALTSEVNQRYEWVMNPKDSKAVSKLTGLGFAWYLGATPAAALVNLTQTAIVTFPVLASRFGAAKSAAALTKGMNRALRNIDGNLGRGLNEEETRAFNVWHASGALERTLSLGLSGLAETDTQAFNPVMQRVSQVVGWLFHHTEMVNREATALAAFRLAREDGDSFADATQYAEDVINESHFDYTNANRARFMQGNTAKVLLLFRQYSLNMTWMLWRNAYLGWKGESPEVRKAARIKLGGILGMTSLFAGVMGMPLMSVMFGLANAAAAAFGGGDGDDEPFDAEVEFRNFLADMLGPGIARAIANGPIDSLSGAEIGNRVSLNDLWLRDPDRELEGQAKADYLLEQAAGPVAGGMLVNTLRGMHLIEEGQTWRGWETILPKAVKDAMKSIRYATQGVNNMRGDPIIEDLGVGGSLLQLAGFSPSSLTERYDANNAAKNYEQKLLKRRASLLDAYAMAWRTSDADTLASVRDQIVEWNDHNPELGITMATIRRSLEGRMQASARAESGVVLDKRVAERARNQARFALDEQ